MAYIKKRKHSSAHSYLIGSAGLGTALLAGMMGSASAATPTTQNASNTTTLPTVAVEASKADSAVGDYLSRHLQSSRFTQPITDTPQTVQVIDEDLIEDQQATTLTEALQNSAGVGTFYAGENGSTSTGDNIYMRGFDTSGSIYVDGVRNTASIHRDMFNTAQVEVIKGPNSTNYGRTAPGGSINLVTKHAHLGNEGSATLSAGSAEHQRATVDWNRQLGEHSALRLNVMWQNSGVPGRNSVENDRWGIAPALSFGLGTGTRINLTYQHVEQNNVPDGRVVTLGLPGYNGVTGYPQSLQAPRVDTDTFYGTTNDHNDITSDAFTAEIEQDISSHATFRNVTRWSRIDQDYLLTAFMATGDSNWASPDFNDWTMSRLPNTKNQTHTVLANKASIIQMLQTGTVEQTLSYGLVLSREKLDTADMNVPLQPYGGGGFATPSFTVNIYNPQHNVPGYTTIDTGAGSHATVDTVAAYLFDSAQLTEQFRLVAALRLDHYSAEMSSRSTTYGSVYRSPNPCATNTYAVAANPDASFSDNLFSWQLGGVYALTGNGNLYANYAVSQQPPGGASLQLNANGRRSTSSANNPKFGPREARTAQIGTKWTFLDKHLSLAASVYQTTVGNQVEKDASSGQYFQTGEKRVRGVELSLVGQITPRWNVNLGITSMDADVTHGAVEAHDGSTQLTYTPSGAFTSWTTYRTPAGLVIGGGARYMGGLTRGGAHDPEGPASTDSYWVADLMASYPISQHLSVQLNVYNVTDEQYIVNINKSGQRYTPGEPRSATVSISYTF